MIKKLRLGDNLPKKLLHVKKSCLGVGLIETITVIETLSIKTHAGNKGLQCEVRLILLAQEECSFLDSGMAKEGRKRNMNKNNWKEGWIE